MVQGYFRYVSADDETKFIGFRKIGRPLRYHRILKQDEFCFNFRKRLTNSTSKTLNKMPPLCVHNIHTNNNVANNMSKISPSITNNNRLKNATIPNKPKQKRRKLDKIIKNNLELSQTDLSLVTSNNYSARKYPHSNITYPYSNKFNHHNKNQRNLVSKNSEKSIHNNYNENVNKYIGATQPRHKFRHFNSRHQHAKRSNNQKGLEIEINP